MTEIHLEPKGVHEDERTLLIDYYVQKVSTRLRQLLSPGENDKKRWIWELLQNAKDCMTQNTTNAVDIVIDVNDDRVVFKHNGQPFTPKALNSLIWQKSGEKRGSSESTGRFGTGFLTTHTLSQNAKLESVLIDNDGKRWGFEVTLNREGDLDEELRNGIEKTLESRRYYENPSGDWTCFTYLLKNPVNRESAKVGIESLKKNLYFNLAFTPEIKSVKLVEENLITTVSRLVPQKISENLNILRFEKNTDERPEKISILVADYNTSNAELSKKYQQERSLRLSIAIQVDEGEKALRSIGTNVPLLFCLFPLIGTEEFFFPVVVNSPDFEPNGERDRILLHGKDFDLEKQLITNEGINKLILERATDLYSKVLNYLSDNNWNNLHVLVKGAKHLPNQEHDFDKTWYKENIQLKIRHSILETKIVETSAGYKKIKSVDGSSNIIFPKGKNKTIIDQIFKFTQDISPEKLPKYEIIEDWSELIWEEDCHFQTLEELIKQVSIYKNVNDLPNLYNENLLEWLNRLIDLVVKEENELLSIYPIIPNQLNEFQLKSLPNFSIDENLPEKALDCLNKFGVNWKYILLNKQIRCLDFPLKRTIENVAIEINHLIKHSIESRNEQLLSCALHLISFVPDDEIKFTKEFIEKRKQIYSFAKELYGVGLKESEIENNFIISIWEEVDRWIIEEMIHKVASFNSIDGIQLSAPKEKGLWLNNFIGFVTPFIRTELFNKEGLIILPCQNGTFTEKSKLSLDVDIPEQFKELVFEKSGIKLKQSLLHKDISSYIPESKMDINSISTIIKEVLQSTNVLENLKLDISLRITELQPNDKIPTLRSNQESLFNIIKMIYGTRLKDVMDPINCCSETIWQFSNHIIISTLIKNIEDCSSNKQLVEPDNQTKIAVSSMEQLRKILATNFPSTDYLDTINWLNSFHVYLHSNELKYGTTVPDQNDNFHSLEDLYLDKEIPNELKDILCLLDRDSDIRNELSLNKLTLKPVHPKTTRDIAEAIDSHVKRIYDGGRGEYNENFKEAVTQLVLNWFNNPRYPTITKLEFKSGNDNMISKEYFEYSWRNRETLEINILWTYNERKEMQSLKKMLSPKDIEALLINPNIIDENQNLKKQNELLKIQINGFSALIENENVAAFMKNPTPENIKKLDNAISLLSTHPSLTAEKLEQLFELEELSKGWNIDKTYSPSEEQIRSNFENGWRGEAYVFKQLQKRGFDVFWPNKSENIGSNIITDFENCQHYIEDKGHKYDLIINQEGGKKAYIQVKSTITDISRADEIALPISTREWDFVNETTLSETYYLARVFNVIHDPEVYYMKIEKTESF